MDKKVLMRTQDVKDRINNFKEVELGYNEEEAIKEAERCLNCQNPRCVKGCPVNIMIPKFIEKIKNRDYAGAYEVISLSSSLSSICGRVCPQELQCEKMCVKGFKSDAISIGALERFVSDYVNNHNLISKPKIIENNKKVALIGSGPASLACAYDLRKDGFDVTIYEVLHKAGGVLSYGIPEFRLPKKIVEQEINKLKDIGVKIKTDVKIGSTITIKDLQKEYDYIFIGTGAGIPKFMNIEGEDANEVFSANEILTRINLMKAYEDNSKTPIKKARKAYVIGGGNVAMDAVRSIKRLGVEAHLMYRRGEEELPARKSEVHHAKEEGIIFDLLENPVKILTDSNNHVTGMEVVSMEYGDVVDGRRSVKEKSGSNHFVECDMVIMALGTTPNHEALFDSNVKLSERGLIITNDSETSVNNIFSGGDAVTGAATVILAMEAGRAAASKIIEREK